MAWAMLMEESELLCASTAPGRVGLIKFSWVGMCHSTVYAYRAELILTLKMGIYKKRP